MSDPNGPAGAEPSEPNPAPPPGATPPPPPPQYAAAPQAPPGQAGAGHGGVGKRFLARIIDGLLVGVPVYIILLVLPGIRPAGLIGYLIMGIVPFAYFLFMETSKGATFGKQWLGMAVRDNSGGAAISMDSSLRRNWWMLLAALQGIPVIGLIAGLASLVIVIVIAVTISSDAQKQGFHDKMANTFVVDPAPA